MERRYVKPDGLRRYLGTPREVNISPRVSGEPDARTLSVLLAGNVKDLIKLLQKHLYQQSALTQTQPSFSQPGGKPKCR